jgi:hypothetical protein
VRNGSAWSDLALESHLKPVLADVFSREIQRRTHNYFARLRERYSLFAVMSICERRKPCQHGGISA